MNLKSKIIVMNRIAERCIKHNIDFRCSLAGIIIEEKYFPIANVEKADFWVDSLLDDPKCPQSNLSFF